MCKGVKNTSKYAETILCASYNLIYFIFRYSFATLEKVISYDILHPNRGGVIYVIPVVS